ncbi:DUF4097 family beta strand repeat-containing protein [Paraglaciecola sp.]|uniref:DUF4097 family beta strand repeat-containing protein n=1 Tax=Paraglaciecola sp. TaxID=1920173 RepID=UPI0030F48867
MKNLSKITSVFSTILLYLALFYSSTLMALTHNESFMVEAGGTLDIQTDVGSIDIRTHQQPSIELIVKIDSQDEDKFTYRTELVKGNLSIVGKLPSGNHWFKNVRVKFELTVPEHYNIELQTSGGSLSIENLRGQVNARTSGGSIKVGNIIGNVKLKTSGGSISTATISGNLNAHTSGGSIQTTIDKQLTDDAKLTTSGGSITADLIEAIQVDLYAATSGGRIKTDFAVDGNIKKQSIEGKINGGGPKLTLKTSGGSIRINSISI